MCGTVVVGFVHCPMVPPVLRIRARQQCGVDASLGWAKPIKLMPTLRSMHQAVTACLMKSKCGLYGLLYRPARERR